jgi:hypothetical protein
VPLFSVIVAVRVIMNINESHVDMPTEVIKTKQYSIFPPGVGVTKGRNKIGLQAYITY